MVERDLAKVETRVRFSSPAPFNGLRTEAVFICIVYVYGRCFTAGLFIDNKENKFKQYGRGISFPARFFRKYKLP